ncbi:hypothetical protein [Clostridium sp.]|uniref:hypothetical protein n=1 Tax=Clostridium sp. TaxID=1506 RepID=UPI0030451F00
MILSEEHIYSGTKKYFRSNSFIILGGQPPRGVDHFPVVEIKDSSMNEKGSKHSYKPDLIAYRNNSFFIVECKPTYDENDYLKLKLILHSEQRLNSLYLELIQRGIFSRNNINLSFDDFKSNTYGVLAYSSEITDNDLYYVQVTNWLKGVANSNITIG